MSISEQLQEAQNKLQLLEQENKVMRLEMIEYKKEINSFIQDNKQLVEENNELYELIKLEQHKSSHSHSLSKEMDLINSYNADLTTQISQYQSLTKRLNSRCKIIQSDNQKYKISLEQLNNKQKEMNKIHINEILKLENTIKKLENECDMLTEQSTDNNVYNKCSIAETCVPFNCLSIAGNAITRIQTIKSSTNTPNVLYNELYVEDINTCGTDITSPIFQFKNYKKSPCMQRKESVHLHCNEKISKLNTINETNEKQINRFRTRIKDLKSRNTNLKIIVHKIQDSKGCAWKQWFHSALLS